MQKIIKRNKGTRPEHLRRTELRRVEGFTLIEVIVVMGVFLFIVGAAIGIFISVVQNQKKVLAEQQLISQVSYIEEYMSKALRMAAADESGLCLEKGGTTAEPIKYIYSLTRFDGDTQLYSGIRFLNQSSAQCQEFFLDKAELYPVLKELKGDTTGVVNTDDGSAIDITSSGVQIDEVRFSINGSSGGNFTSDSCNPTGQCGATSADPVQPRVTILLNILIPNTNGAACDINTPCNSGQKCHLATSKCASVKTIQTTVSQRNLNVK